MIVEETATLDESPAFQLKVAELKKYWNTLRGLKYEIDRKAARRRTVAVQIAATGLTPELRAAFGIAQNELRLAWDIQENVDRIKLELINEMYDAFGIKLVGPMLPELYQKWEHAIQHGLD